MLPIKLQSDFYIIFIQHCSGCTSVHDLLCGVHQSLDGLNVEVTLGHHWSPYHFMMEKPINLQNLAVFRKEKKVIRYTRKTWETCHFTGKVKAPQLMKNVILLQDFLLKNVFRIQQKLKVEDCKFTRKPWEHVILKGNFIFHSLFLMSQLPKVFIFCKIFKYIVLKCGHYLTMFYIFLCRLQLISDLQQ